MKTRIITILSPLIISISSMAQTYVTIGQNDISNDISQHQQFVPTSFPNAKVQVLLRNLELTTAGLKPGDQILGVEWYVVVDGTPSPTTYDIYLTDDYMSDTIPYTVMYPVTGANFATISPTLVGSALIDSGTYTGWHTANFSTPFIWDGSDNMIIQVCRSGNSQAGDDNIAIYNDTVTTMVTGYNHSCSSTTGYYVKDKKPYLRLVVCPVSRDTLNVTECKNYTSPSGKVYTSSISFIDTIPNSAGCDSLITINLTIANVDSSVSQNGTTLSAVSNIDTYQWINCTDSSVIFGATNQQFSVTENGDYAVIVESQGCVDTSGCFSFVNIGMAEPKDLRINIHPNPSNGNVSIKLASTGTVKPVQVELMNQLGQTEHIYYCTGDLQIKVEKSGIYYLKIQSADQMVLKKLIVTK